MTTVYIYGLVCPLEDKVMYVGRTQYLRFRLKQHLDEAKSGKMKTRKSEWIRSLLLRGALPSMMIIDTCSQENSAETEAYWIRHYKSINPALKNFEWWKDAESGRMYTAQSGGIDAIKKQDTIYRKKQQISPRRMPMGKE